MTVPDTANKPLVPAALVGAIVAISFAAPLFLKTAPTHPLIAAGLRLAFASVLLSPFVVRAVRRGTLPRSSARAAVLAGLCYALHFGAWVSSLMLSSVAASVTLVTATPLLLAVVALVTGKDLPDRRLWLALAVAAAGIVTIGWADFQTSSDALRGDALAFIGMVAMAGYLLLARAQGPTLDVLAFSGVATVCGAVTLLGVAAAMGIPIRAASTEALLFIVAATLLPQMVGHTLLTWCLRHTTPTAVGLATVAEPVGASILAWFWLGESIDPLTGVGCVLTIVAVMAVVLRSDARTVGTRDASP
jgi:drug/metabolite transporter (DMT)-like permease